MSQPPLVSILLPTYKRSHYLAEAIPTALAQTYSHFELLVLDDASPDNTPEVLRSFEGDKRVRYIRHPKNLGLPGNWRAGLQIARGDYLCVLEDDDCLHPTFIERLLEPLRVDPEVLFAFCDHWVVRADGTQDLEATARFTKNYKRIGLLEGPVPDPARTVLLHQSVSLTAALFRRQLVPPTLIDDAARGAMDLWLAYHSLRAREQGCVHYIPERLMDYRVHGAAMSNQAPVYITEGMVHVYSHIVEDEAFRVIRDEAQRKLRDYQTALGFSYLAQGRTAEARSIFAQSRQYGASSSSVMGSLLSLTGAMGAALCRMVRHVRAGETSSA